MDDPKKEERRGFVRLPITLYCDAVEFEPDVYLGRVIRSAYDIELTEYDAKIMYAGLKKRLEEGLRGPIRIRVIGRLVS